MQVSQIFTSVFASQEQPNPTESCTEFSCGRAPAESAHSPQADEFGHTR
jgi:hypothetical protein